MDKGIHKEYIENLIDSMLHNADERNSNVKMIEHYNTLDLTYDDVMEMSMGKEDVRFLYHSYEIGDMVTAFEPFLDWIKELFYEIADESLEEFFEHSGVYLLHRPVFKSYFETGVCVRKEEIIINEVDFEIEKFYKEICKMLARLSEKKKLMLVLNKIHYAGNSTINLINEFMSGIYGNNIAIFATYNELFGVPEYCQEDWNQVVSKLDAIDGTVEWVFNTTIEKRETKEPLEFIHERIPEYIDKLRNMCDFLAFGQADYYLDMIYHKMEVEMVNIGIEDKFNFLQIHAYVAMNLDKVTDALMYCDGMRLILEDYNDDMMAYSYNYLKAQISINSTQKENADIYVNQCKELSEKIGDKFLVFKSKLLDLMNEFSGWKNLWLLMEDKYVSPETLEECKYYEYYNHLAHIYVYAFDNDAEKYRDVESVEQNITHYNKGIEIANKIGNDRFLIDAYKKSVMTASSNGFFGVSNYFYDQCYKVVSKIGSEFEQANIYNGMGYNCSTMEKYSKASEYFNKALSIFVKYNDVNYICETLYNMAINGILAEEYTYADQYLNICIKACRLIKSDGIRVCNISKLYGLRALCNYEMNILYSCKINYQYLERCLGHMAELEEMDESSRLWEDDLILYHMIGAVIREKEKDYEEAYMHLCKVDNYMKRASGSMFLFIVPFSIAYANVCKALGKDEEARMVYEKAIEYCSENGYIDKTNKIQACMDGMGYVPRGYDIRLKDITPDEIMDLITSNIVKSDYIIQKDKIEFVNVWQKLIGNNDDSLEKVIRNAITTLKNTFSIDEFVFIRLEDGELAIKYNDSKYGIDQDKVAYMKEYFSLHRNAFCTTRLDKEYVDHKELIDKVFGVNNIKTWMFAPIFEDEKMQGLFIVCTDMCSDWNHRIKRNAFVDGDIGIMLLMFRQLMDAIERMENRQRIEKINNELEQVNERLKKIAVSDMLTGLYNRQGFAEELGSLINKVENYKQTVEWSILYIDLDNFKHYNDEFGHDVGDFILVQFAELLKKICGPEGYVVRYGGDEFVVIIHSVNRDVVEAAVKEIYAILKEEKGFTDKISKMLGQNVSIPEDKYVSCSVGIASVIVTPDDSARDKIRKTIKRADEMMYYIKKTDKRRYVFFEDVNQ